MKDFLPIVKLACLTAAAALIVSCGGGADYRNVLPADSFVTMSVDAASLLKKSGTCDAASNPLLDRLKAELDKAEELSAEEKEYLFSLLENPVESGLDLKKELFLFMSADGADINNPEVGGGRRQIQTGRPDRAHQREERHRDGDRGGRFGGEDRRGVGGVRCLRL